MLMEVRSAQGRGGLLMVYNAASRGIVQVGASLSGCCGILEVYEGDDNAKPKVALGVSTTDNGMVEIGGEEAVAQITNRGLVVGSADLKPVAMLRMESDRGYLELRNPDGVAAARLWASDTGGRLEIGTEEPEVILESAEQRGALWVLNGANAVSAGVWASEKGGAIQVNGPTGAPAAKIEAPDGPGKMTLLGNSAVRTTLGVSADDAGLIMLNSAKNSTMMLHGHGVLRTTNPAGKEVVDFGIDPGGNGILDVRHSSGVGGVRLDVSNSGSGNVKIHTPPFEIKAQLGVKDGDKGDVCVMGGKGLVCLSAAFVKTFIPW
jgi:hypothetical protein